MDTKTDTGKIHVIPIPAKIPAKTVTQNAVNAMNDDTRNGDAMNNDTVNNDTVNNDSPDIRTPPKQPDIPTTAYDTVTDASIDKYVSSTLPFNEMKYVPSDLVNIA